MTVKTFFYVSEEFSQENVYFLKCFNIFGLVFWTKSTTFENNFGMIVKLAFTCQEEPSEENKLVQWKVNFP